MTCSAVIAWPSWAKAWAISRRPTEPYKWPSSLARAAMVEAHRDYPVPKNMSLGEAEMLLGRLLA